jgi:hypothetical protein
MILSLDIIVPLNNINRLEFIWLKGVPFLRYRVVTKVFFSTENIWTGT